MIAPLELGLSLKSDIERLWTGEWSADFEAISEERKENEEQGTHGVHEGKQKEEETNGDGDYDFEEESVPPEYDLRTGRYVSHSRPKELHNSKKGNLPPQVLRCLIEQTATWLKLEALYRLEQRFYDLRGHGKV
jgi:diphthamide biosynthesis protein 2